MRYSTSPGRGTFQVDCQSESFNGLQHLVVSCVLWFPHCICMSARYSGTKSI